MKGFGTEGADRDTSKPKPTGVLVEHDGRIFHGLSPCPPPSGETLGSDGTLSRIPSHLPSGETLPGDGGVTSKPPTLSRVASLRPSRETHRSDDGMSSKPPAQSRKTSYHHPSRDTLPREGWGASRSRTPLNRPSRGTPPRDSGRASRPPSPPKSSQRSSREAPRTSRAPSPPRVYSRRPSGDTLPRSSVPSREPSHRSFGDQNPPRTPLQLRIPSIHPTPGTHIHPGGRVLRSPPPLLPSTGVEPDGVIIRSPPLHLLIENLRSGIAPPQTWTVLDSRGRFKRTGCGSSSGGPTTRDLNANEILNSGFPVNGGDDWNKTNTDSRDFSVRPLDETPVKKLDNTFTPGKMNDKGNQKDQWSKKKNISKFTKVKINNEEHEGSNLKRAETPIKNYACSSRKESVQRNEEKNPETTVPVEIGWEEEVQKPAGEEEDADWNITIRNLRSRKRKPNQEDEPKNKKNGAEGDKRKKEETEGIRISKIIVQMTIEEVGDDPFALGIPQTEKKPCSKRAATVQQDIDIVCRIKRRIARAGRGIGTEQHHQHQWFQKLFITCCCLLY